MKKRNPFDRIVFFNLLILIIYASGMALYSSIIDRGEMQSLSYLISMVMLLGIHVLICISIAITIYFSASQPDKIIGKAYFTSGVLVLLIGFGTCLGTASIL